MVEYPKAPNRGKENLRARSPELIREFRRSRREIVRVSLDRYKESDLINIRAWFIDAEGELRPTRDGIALAVKHLPALAQALHDALTRAQELGIVTADSEEAKP